MMQLIHRPSRGRNGFLCLWAESELKLSPGWALLSVGPAAERVFLDSLLFHLDACALKPLMVHLTLLTSFVCISLHTLFFSLSESAWASLSLCCFLGSLSICVHKYGMRRCMYYLGGKSMDHRNYLPKASGERSLEVCVKVTSWSFLLNALRKVGRLSQHIVV